MRQPSKPSTAQCNSRLYTLFLLSEPKYVSCVRLSEILAPLSHDSVNRFLLRERYTPRDLFDEVKGNINWTAGTLSVDDSVEDKPYRDPSKSAFVDYFCNQLIVLPGFARLLKRPPVRLSKELSDTDPA